MINAVFSHCAGYIATCQYPDAMSRAGRIIPLVTGLVEDPVPAVGVAELLLGCLEVVWSPLGEFTRSGARSAVGSLVEAGIGCNKVAQAHSHHRLPISSTGVTVPTTVPCFSVNFLVP